MAGFKLLSGFSSKLCKQLMRMERVHDILPGLNLECDQIRVQVLGHNPFPTLRQDYVRVEQEESRSACWFLENNNFIA